MEKRLVKELTDKWLAEAKKNLDKAESFKGLSKEYHKGYNDVAQAYIKCAQELRYLNGI